MRTIRSARRPVAAAGAAVVALALAACGGGSGNGGTGEGGGGGGGASGTLTVGTTEQITSLDPAGSYDNGSFAVMNQVYPFLMNSPYGTSEVEPDIAESAEFTAPTEYTVTLKEGLTFANGNELTASDVKFTFDRQVAIADENGPSSLLYNLDSVEVVDDLTVVFHLKSENDQIFPQILSSPVGPIVDEEVFSADAVTPDQEIVDGNAFAGQYAITQYAVNDLVQYKANPEYQGILGAPATETVNVKYYTDSSNLKLDVEQGNIDVAFRTLSATDVEDLRTKDTVKVVDGPGGEIRYLVFNFNTMPFGAETPEADEAKALAVRQAVAHLVDREAISEDVYKGTFTPLYSYVPEGLTGATESLKEKYGDGNGAPDPGKATEVLEAAGVETPVELNIQYVAERYGPSSGDEYAVIKEALEEGGLFTVNLQSTEWVQYSADRTADVYPIYQLGWFPDYSDADNYLTPFFLTENFLVNHYSNPQVDEMLLRQAVTTDPDERTALIEEIQDVLADDLSTIPYMQGAQVAVVGTDVEGAENTLDGSFKFRYGALSKG
ncbi:ABC transporter substrate-binding protein [Isoptericola variabilis]|uniref:ABC-type transporter, periplasmic subunit n=1 Tax=Isoptericola variabilis (strain 225) TaxID=743718 RepID=F6FVR5_ISOV2|nr:ABC transporter substrate-binding protein [Isoptericola variabilis]AEG45566.1 ABC-type transporter, periplasmic subunit [Isoptericola variabilis 225]TWH25826.1 peptide/nickel transport system substrate-binding protein [Isoptericola variabilis J7]